MIHRLVLAAMLMAAAPAQARAPSQAPAQEPAETGAMLVVEVQDASSFDWIRVRHEGGCGPLFGVLTIDFASSAGRVVIDTEYGGRGTLHPRGVRVVDGPVEVARPVDGARAIEISLAGLPPDDQAVVTLDIDSEGDAPQSGSIVATARDIAGSRARFAPAAGDPAEAAFGAAGRAVLEVPCTPPGLM